MNKAEAIVAALGGADNIVEIEPCSTRLRAELVNFMRVDEAALKAAGTHGVLRTDVMVQIIVGPEAHTLATDMENLLL